MKNFTFLFLFTFLGAGIYAQCPIPSTAFVGDYSITQTTPNNAFLGVPAFNTQVITLSAGVNPNERVFTAIYAEAANIGQPAMDVIFTLDCPNGSDVVVSPGLDTFLTCNQVTNITLGPASTVGTFDENDDSSFTLILEEFQDTGGCPTTPATVEFILTKASCAAPQNPNISNITNTTADLSWTDTNGPGTTFNVEYGVQGFALGTGTVLSGLTGTSTQLTGLMQGNYYEVYITADCGSSTSIPAGPTEFLNPSDCDAVYVDSYPQIEDFDSLADFDSCYTVVDQDGNGTGWIQQTLELSPGVIGTFATNGTNTAQKEDYLFSPPFTYQAGTVYEHFFDYNGADGTNPANENLEVIIAAGNTVADANAGTTIFTDTGIVQNGDFANIENQALTGNGQFTPTTTGEYHIVFKSTAAPVPPSTTTGFLLIFDYRIEEVLSVDEFESSSFNYFVDGNNMLNLSANQVLETVILHNLVGQQVLTQKLNAQEGIIDLNRLASGVYLAQVQLNGASKSFKIVKK